MFRRTPFSPPLPFTGRPFSFLPRPPLPLFVLQPVLAHIVTSVAARHPSLFRRLGRSSSKRFLIDPSNLPFALLLLPDPKNPRLRAVDRDQGVAHDVAITGSFLTLLSMIDGQSDSDTAFFNRGVTITGDTEAIVALRNALDDMDTTLIDNVADAFGPLSQPIRTVLDFAKRFAPSDQ